MYINPKIFKFFFIVLIGSFPVNIYAIHLNENIEDLNNEIEEQQNQCIKCDNLNNIRCIKKEIHCLCEIDQSIRNKSINLTSSGITAKQENKLYDLLVKVDVYNTKELQTILKLHGWLTISKFGKKTDQEAWLLVQHADHDPIFQAGIAFILEQLATIKETDPKNFAYLYDRVATNFQNLGLKQKYGTQATMEQGVFKLAPYEGAMEELNSRRKKIGLNSITKYLQDLKKVYANKQ